MSKISKFLLELELFHGIGAVKYANTYYRRARNPGEEEVLPGAPNQPRPPNGFNLTNIRPDFTPALYNLSLTNPTKILNENVCLCKLAIACRKQLRIDKNGLEKILVWKSIAQVIFPGRNAPPSLLNKLKSIYNVYLSPYYETLEWAKEKYENSQKNDNFEEDDERIPSLHDENSMSSSGRRINYNAKYTDYGLDDDDEFVDPCRIW